MTPEEWAELDAAAKRADRTGPWLLRYLVRQFCPHVAEATLPVGETTARQRCGNGAATVSESYPREDTRARESSGAAAESKKGSSACGTADEIAYLLRTLRWYGAGLAMDSSPDEFASRLLGAFPTVDIQAELHRASAWLGESPKNRKKLLGRFLLGWMGRVGKGPDSRPRESTTQKQARQQNYLPGVRAPGGDWK